MTFDDRQPRRLEPAQITDAEAAVMFCAVRTLFHGWEISDEQAAILLGFPVRTLVRWSTGTPGPIDREGKERLTSLLAIDEALRAMFPDQQHANDWLNAPHQAFGGRSALQVMLDGTPADLLLVRQLVEAERAG